MKAKTLQIAWHPDEDNQNFPILTVDIHPKYNIVATGSADKEIKLWRLQESKDESTSWQCLFICSLSTHQQTVNSVRFSPDGSTLASVSDDKTAILWRPVERKNTWDRVRDPRHVQKQMLVGHSADIYSLTWAPDSAHIATGAINRQVIVWDTTTGSSTQHKRDHSHYVQGLAWDPRGHFLASTSCDRTLRVYITNARKAALRNYKERKRDGQIFVPHATVKARDFPGTARPQPAPTPNPPAESASPPANSPAGAVPEAATATAPPPKSTKPAKPLRHRMFKDETLPSFFRQPDWLPDGSFLIVPSGQFQSSPDAEPENTTYVFSRNHLDKPAFHLRCGSKPSIAVRCSPVLYKLRDTGLKAATSEHNTGSLSESDAKKSTVGLLRAPFRMLFAVATLDSVLVYDTQQLHPICCLKNLHYEKLTDIAWSSDGRVLIMASIDGYCSLVVFDDGELGEVLPKSEWPAVLTAPKPTASAGTPTRNRAPSAGSPATASPRAVSSSKPAASPKRTPVSSGAGAGVRAGAGAGAGAGDGAEQGCGGDRGKDAPASPAVRSDDASKRPAPPNRSPQVKARDAKKKKRRRIAPVLLAADSVSVQSNLLQ